MGWPGQKKNQISLAPGPIKQVQAVSGGSLPAIARMGYFRIDKNKPGLGQNDIEKGIANNLSKRDI